MSQSTVAANTTTGGGADGGGVYASHDAYIYSSTFSGNTTSGSIAEGGALAAGNARIFNSILLGNAAFNAGGDEVSGTNEGNTVSFYGQNIVGTGASQFDASVSGNVDNANIFNVFKQTLETTSGSGVFKGHLSSNGGPVQTIALKGTKLNPALDIADDAFLQAEIDAHGEQRKFDWLGFHNDGVNVADLGAYELNLFDEASAIPRSLIVTTGGGEADPFDDETSLREAVVYANSLEEASTVTFASQFGEAFFGSVTIDLTEGEMLIENSLTIDGTGAGNLTIDAGGLSRIFNVASPDAATFALKNISLTNGNTASGGGAIRIVDGNDRLVLEGVAISNSSANGGGAVYATGAQFQITNSSFVGNHANFGGSAILANGNANGWIVNSTISGNDSGSGAGAIQQQSSGASNLHLRNVTVADNVGSGVVNFAYGSGTAVLEIGNSILSGNSALNLSNFGDGTATFNSLGNNISDDESVGFGGSGDQTGINPMLETLANNGGGTLTHAFDSNSAAVDAGNDEFVLAIEKPVGVTSSTSADDFFPASNLLANTTITRTNYATTPDSSGSWVTVARNGATGDYFDNSTDPNPVLTFDLGSVELLSEVAIWGYSIATARTTMSKNSRLSSPSTAGLRSAIRSH